MNTNKQPLTKAQNPFPKRPHRAGNWVESLQQSDVSQLWIELNRVVSYHPLVRSSRNAGLLVEEGSQNAYKDLTQELFVTLLSKERFQYYLEAEMTNAEIEAEIGQIELTNLLTAQLRKRYPESYRLARRVSTLLQTSQQFRRLDNRHASLHQPAQHRRLVARIYGLSHWPDHLPRRSQAEIEQRINQVPIRQRDTRKVGCSGDSQVVISNADLEDLIVKVLEAIDSPTDIRSLRSLVMSRLPVMDINLVPIGGSHENEDEGLIFEPRDLQENPEQNLLSREAENQTSRLVEEFLENLKTTVRSKHKQYNRILCVLWHCYLSTEGKTQLEIADHLGVSDSLVSDYRRRIETQLQALAFIKIEQARQFEQTLHNYVRKLIKAN